MANSLSRDSSGSHTSSQGENKSFGRKFSDKHAEFLKKHSCSNFPPDVNSEASRNFNSMFDLYEKSQGAGKNLTRRL